MITGHLGIAAGARSFSRKPMGPILFIALLMAAFVPDAVDTLYWALNFCSPYGLYSHTTWAVVLEAAIVGGAAFLATGSRGIALTFTVVVLLHSPADYFTGRKLFAPGGEMLGLRLYERPLLDCLLEGSVLLVGWLLLRRSGRGPRWATSIWAFVAMLLVQTTLDAFVIGRGEGHKPNACPVVASPIDR